MTLIVKLEYLDPGEHVWNSAGYFGPVTDFDESDKCLKVLFKSVTSLRDFELLEQSSGSWHVISYVPRRDEDAVHREYRRQYRATVLSLKPALAEGSIDVPPGL